jgi:hypothetical protein
MKLAVVIAVILCGTVNRVIAFGPSDSVRSKYIGHFPNYFFIWPVVKQRSISFDIQNANNRGQKLTYRPNGNYNLGFGMYVFKIGFELSFSVQPNASSQRQYGHSQNTDLQWNMLGKNFGLDLFTQNYNGFYQTDASKPVGAGIPYPQRPDISIWNTGVNGIYLFNSDKYSIRAAYNFSERQLKSAGSFLLTGTVNAFSLRADSAVYGPRYESAFGVNADFSKLDYTTVSIAPGYAHTFVFKNIFLNASFSIGPATHWLYYQSAAVSKHDVTFNSFIDARVAIGYNSDRFFTGVTFVAQARNIKFEEVQFTNTNTAFNMVIGYRFREFGILKKRATDFLPFRKKKPEAT